jgi:hypothetical protein
LGDGCGDVDQCDSGKQCNGQGSFQVHGVESRREAEI